MDLGGGGRGDKPLPPPPKPLPPPPKFKNRKPGPSPPPPLKSASPTNISTLLYQSCCRLRIFLALIRTRLTAPSVMATAERMRLQRSTSAAAGLRGLPGKK